MIIFNYLTKMTVKKMIYGKNTYCIKMTGHHYLVKITKFTQRVYEFTLL